MHQPRKPSIHHFVRSIVMFGASLLVVTSPLHAATGGGKASGELLPPSGASKVATAKTGDPGWLMVMMMTHPNVRAAVLGAKATAAPVGWSPAVVAKGLNRCGNRSTATTASSGKTAGAATIPAAFVLKPKKAAKKTRLTLLKGRMRWCLPRIEVRLPRAKSNSRRWCLRRSI